MFLLSPWFDLRSGSAVRGPFICCHHAQDVISVLKLFSLIERAGATPKQAQKKLDNARIKQSPKKVEGRNIL
jgi:hypothetical protein